MLASAITTPCPLPCWKLVLETASHATALLDAAFVIAFRSSWYSDADEPAGRVKKTLVSWSRIEVPEARSAER